MAVCFRPLLNFAETCKALNCSQSWLRLQLSQGKGPVGIKLAGSTHWQFRPDDIEAFLEACVAPQVTEPPPPSPSIVARQKRRAAEIAAAEEAEAAQTAARSKVKRARVRETA